MTRPKFVLRKKIQSLSSLNFSIHGFCGIIDACDVISKWQFHRTIVVVHTINYIHDDVLKHTFPTPLMSYIRMVDILCPSGIWTCLKSREWGHRMNMIVKWLYDFNNMFSLHEVKWDQKWATFSLSNVIVTTQTYSDKWSY